MGKGGTKFVRFVCARDHPTVDAELGLFSARDSVDFSTQPGSIPRRHDEAFYWFTPDGGGGLTYPKLTGKNRRRDVRKALFWFHAKATFYNRQGGLVIDRVRDLSRVMGSAGCEIREIWCDDPGRILFEDSKQVLAVPTVLPIPRAFDQRWGSRTDQKG